jgi:hypothetical protein
MLDLPDAVQFVVNPPIKVSQLLLALRLDTFDDMSDGEYTIHDNQGSQKLYAEPGGTGSDM